MREELASIEENGTWSLTDLPEGKKSIGVKRVYKLKRDAAGNILKHKARLVGASFSGQGLTSMKSLPLSRDWTPSGCCSPLPLSSSGRSTTWT